MKIKVTFDLKVLDQMVVKSLLRKTKGIEHNEYRELLTKIIKEELFKVRKSSPCDQ